MKNNNNIIDDISERISDIRSESGLTQKELADRAGITQGALSQIENGNRTPTLLVLRKLARALNISVEDLIGEPTYEYPDDIKLRKFYKRYQLLIELSDKDQRMILDMAKRLKK